MAEDNEPVCDKIIYKTRREIIQVMRAMNKETGQNFKSYTCANCGGLHIATLGKKPIRRLDYNSYNKDIPFTKSKKKPFVLNPFPKRVNPDVQPLSTDKIMNKQTAATLKQLVENSKYLKP